jgi:3-isopropylmalate dehydratase small subunit
MTMPRKLPTISGGSGPRLVRHTGIVACIEVRDDEGQLIPPDVALESVRDASILIAPQLFESLTPETTVARLTALQARVVISPGFEARLHQRCISSGLLALPLGEETVLELAEWAASRSSPVLTIDLDAQTIEPSGSEIPAYRFEVDPRVRRKLLLGLTDEEEMLQHVGSAAAKRTEDRQRRPWLYEPR